MPLLWASGAAAAALLVLGVNGTLSSWSSAIITNGNNDVASAKSVALSETGGDGTNGASCDTAASTNNTASCTTVNKYGGVAGGGSETGAYDASSNKTGFLAPGDSRSATVTMANDGTGSGELTLVPGSCSHVVNDATGGDTTADYDLCTQIKVAVSCTNGYTFAAAPLADITYANATLDVGALDAGDSTDCTFTVNLPANTPSGYSNQLASQSLVWTLTAS